MRPRVIADFVSFCDLALKNCRVLFNTLAEYEECKLDVPLRCHIKQLRGAGCVRAIIEGHRDIRSVDVHVGERDFLSDSFFERWTGWCSGFVLRADNRHQNDEDAY